MGLHYDMGDGVTQNFATAAQYYQRVINSTEHFKRINCAANDLGALYAAGKGVAQNDQEAKAFFRQAAMRSMEIALPKDAKITNTSAVKGFQVIYSKYRLAVAKKLPLGTTTLTSEEIAMAKVVADYYQSQCRG